MFISIFKGEWGELTMMIVVIRRMITKTMSTKNYDDEEECATLQGGSGEGRDQSQGPKATSGEARSVTWVTLGS